MSLRIVSGTMVALIAIGSIAPAYANFRHRDGSRHFSGYKERGYHHRRGYRHSGNWIIRGILSTGTR